MNEMIQKAALGLQKRGYEALCVATPEEAAAVVMREAGAFATVGWGGSESIKALGVREKLADKAAKDGAIPELFLLSANALTADGRLVNIDGRGNRIATSIHGPKRVIYVVGRNKLVEGGVDEAIARIKRCACPPNCRRLGKKTPCAETGVCADCDSPDRICKVTVVFERRPTVTPTLVILVDADLGF